MNSMRLLIVILALHWLCPPGVHAQSRVRIYARVAEFASVDPLRKINGEFYDLSPLFAWYKVRAQMSDDGNVLLNPPKQTPPWDVVDGRVTQITDEGVLIYSAEFDVFRWLKNWTGAKTASDNDRVCVLATPIGTYSYTTVLGAKKTVPAYDYGLLPTAEEMAKLKAAAAKAEAERKAKAQAEVQRKIDEGKARTAAFLKAQQEKKEKEQKEKEAKEKEQKEKELKEEKKE